MNIQIFGRKKCFDTKKAERWFKERSIKYQFIDMNDKGMSRGEFRSICRSVGGADKLVDDSSKDKELLTLLDYLTPDDRDEKILENQHIIKTPVVRCGAAATVGYCPDIWKNWK